MVHSDMLCFVQAFTSSKKKDKNDSTTDNNDTEVSSSKSAKKSFSRKLSFSLKKKSPTSATTSQYDDKTESSPDLSPESYCYFPENMNDQEVSLQQHAAAAAAAEELLTNTPGSSKARQKKFHRNFKDVPPEEKVIDYYSCALVGEVLIHGYLYITKNYFAFYSNLFGNVNKFLVPTTAVLSITKNKTPGIKANTVTVITLKEKHVFGLFLSRDSTYKLMIQVWNAAMKPLPSQYLLPPSKEFLREISKLPINDNQSMNGDESSLSGSDININGSSEIIQHSLKKYVKPIENTDVSTVSTSKMSSKVDECCQTTVPSWSQYINSSSKTNIVMGTSTILLAILFLSAGILLYRISCLQQNYSQDKDYFSTTRSMSEVQEFLNSNLHHISKVRKSLEALSSLIEKHSPDVPQNNQDFDATASLTENIPS